MHLQVKDHPVLMMNLLIIPMVQTAQFLLMYTHKQRTNNYMEPDLPTIMNLEVALIID